jgi:uncharacterized repeat protein (TIGR02543 family)
VASNWVNGTGTFDNELAAGMQEVCNDANFNNNLSFNVNRDYLFESYTTLQSEIDNGRPLVHILDGHSTYGNHAVTAMGYKETSQTKWVIVKDNWNGDTEKEVDWDEATFSIIKVTPGGTPADHYESDDSFSTAKEIFPDGLYTFRQTHNFYTGGDIDAIKFQAYASRRYTIETKNLGANCDTEIGLVGKSGSTTYTIATDDNSGSGNASKIVWSCYDATDSPFYIVVNEKYNRSGHLTNYDIEISWESIVVPQTPTPISPADNETVSSLTPAFSWSAYQHGGDNETQTGYQLRVRSDTDGDIVVYDTGYVASSSGRTHQYTPGAYSGYDSIAECNRYSNPLEQGKHYHWHVRYRDSGGDWSAWSSDAPNPHQDFYTPVPQGQLRVTIQPQEAVNAGAMWKLVNESTWRASGFTHSLDPDTYEIEFKPVTGWIKPGNAQIGVASGQLTQITSLYTVLTYTLNVSVNPPGGGSVTKNPNKTAYDHGETVLLTASESPGYTFNGWTGSQSGSAKTLTVTMNGNKSITANFIAVTYTLNVNVNPSGSGSVTINPTKTSYNHNETVVLTPSPVSGYRFSGWSGTETGLADPLTLTMTENETITANFAPLSEGILSVTPDEDFNSSGEEGGPFTPSGKTYTVTNTGESPIDFTVTKTAAWLTLSNSGQSLSKDENAVVTVSINSNADNLGEDTYTDTVSFTNTTNGNGNTGIDVTLVISSTVPPPTCGETWAFVPLTGAHLGAAYGNATFVSVGAEGIVHTSADGLHWTSQTSGTTSHLYSIAYGNSTFVAVGSTGAIITSGDGIDWTTRTSGTTAALRDITYGNSQFIAVGYYGKILTSADGIDWTIQTSGSGEKLQGVVYGDSQYAVVGNNGAILTSPGGTNWTQQSSPIATNINSVAFGGNQFAAAGLNGEIITSSDGANWFSQSSGTSNHLFSVLHSAYGFTVSGDAGTLLSSSDGIDWTARASGTQSALQAVTFGNSRLVAAGSGITLYSTCDSTVPPIVVLEPNGGERVPSGNPYTIKWSSTAAIAEVNIECSLDSGNSWDDIITGMANMIGMFRTHRRIPVLSASAIYPVRTRMPATRYFR